MFRIFYKTYKITEIYTYLAGRKTIGAIESTED